MRIQLLLVANRTYSIFRTLHFVFSASFTNTYQHHGYCGRLDFNYCGPFDGACSDISMNPFPGASAEAMLAEMTRTIPLDQIMIWKLTHNCDVVFVMP